MPPPENPPLPKPANLLTKQVPWGARKPAAPPPAAAPITAPISAKQVPWGSTKPTAKVAPPETPAEIAPASISAAPSPVPAPKPGFVARLVPWATRKKAAASAPPPIESPALEPSHSTWALPKDPRILAAGASEPAPAEPDSAGEPTAEQLVAILTRRLARTREKREVPEYEIYHAKPISFAATRWDVVKLWADAHRLQLYLVAVALVFILGTAQFLRLASLNTEVGHKWHDLESVLRQRYALIPSYVDCITTYSSEERYTLAVTEKGLAAWRTAQTDRETVIAAERLERILTLLAKVTKRYDQTVVAKDDDEADASLEFARLEGERKKTLFALRDAGGAYNEIVGKFNANVDNPPGSWIAAAARLHERLPFMVGSR